MKKIKAIALSIIAVVAMVIAMPNAQAQTLTPDMRKMAVVEMRKQLPMEVTEGMTWTKCDLSQDGNTMIWTFKVNPRQMGVSLAEAKSELNGYTNSEFKALLGDDFQQVLDMFGCDVQIVLVFPDNTTKKFRIRQ